MRPARLALVPLFLLASCRDKPVVRYWTAMDCNFDATVRAPGGAIPAQ